VGRNRDGSVADLLDALAISKQALNIPLRQLMSMELIESKRTSKDARIKMLRLTPTGKRLEARLTEAQSNLLTNVFDESGPNAEDSWRDVMRILSKSSDDQ
jgi:DNA-binding MarR family transcriptional regulator